MRHKLVNFTRGSQLIGHFGFMFAAGLKAPLIFAALIFIGLIWWRAAASLSDQEAYLCWMRAYAGIIEWFEFDPDRPVNLELASGRLHETTIAQLSALPFVVSAWAKLATAVRSGALLAALVTGPLTVAFAWVASWFGRRSKESKHERGATIATLPALIAEVEAHNARERGRRLRQAFGAAWRLTTPAERAAIDLHIPYSLAGVPFPWRLEQSHAMLIGTTGTGKTVAMLDLLAQAREREARAVVFDLTGAYIEAFFDPARDIILNPLDARCPQWSVFEDCTDEATLTAAAEALVPHDGGGAEQFWVLAARMLFVEMCLKLIAERRATNAALSAELMTASLTHVHKLMQGTVADPLTAPEAARMAESIRAVFNANAKALKMLPTSGAPFSIRRWIDSDCAPGSFLFVAARYIDMPVASRLLTVWMDTAITGLMAGPRSADLKLWFLFDELGALHRLPAIEKGLQTVRNYGGAIVAGVHAYSKLKETYGDNMAMTLAALARTKLMLATADRESAIWCSDFIGHRQYREMEEGYSYGYNNARDAVSLTPKRQIEPLLLPDQLMNLARLQGYLKFPDGFPAAPVQLAVKSYPRRAEAFVERVQADRRTPAGGEVGRRRTEQYVAAHAAQSDHGPGPAPALRPAERPEPIGLQQQFDFEAKPDSSAAALNVASVPPARANAGDVRAHGTQGDLPLPQPAASPRTSPDEAAAPTEPVTVETIESRSSPQHLDRSRLRFDPAPPENLSLRELKTGVVPDLPRSRDDSGIEP